MAIGYYKIGGLDDVANLTVDPQNRIAELVQALKDGKNLSKRWLDWFWWWNGASNDKRKIK
jgi:hypothetical protein